MTDIPTIPFQKFLAPYFKIAQEEAKKSPCSRRQYGALLAYTGYDSTETTFELYEASHNVRMSPCCNDFCVRDRVNTRHGGSIEIGGEIHAEISLLVKRKTKTENRGYFILVGFEKGKELYGPNVYPCHACAIGIRFAGYSHIFIRQSKDNIVPISVADIINYRIQEWEPVDN